jgi:hypothetical protein
MKDGVVSRLGEYTSGSSDGDSETYYERNSKMLVSFVGTEGDIEEYYVLENGSLNQWHCLEITHLRYSEDQRNYFVDGKEVDLADYKSYVENLTADINNSAITIGTDWNQWIYGAYQTLNN